MAAVEASAPSPTVLACRPDNGALISVNLDNGGVYDPRTNTWATLPAPGGLVALSRSVVDDDETNTWLSAAHAIALDWNTCWAPAVFGDRGVVDCGSTITVVDPLHADVRTLSIAAGRRAPAFRCCLDWHPAAPLGWQPAPALPRR